MSVVITDAPILLVRMILFRPLTVAREPEGLGEVNTRVGLRPEPPTSPLASTLTRPSSRAGSRRNSAGPTSNPFELRREVSSSQPNLAATRFDGIRS